MKTMLILLVLLMAMAVQGCGTIKGTGQLLGGIGKDLQDVSDGYSKEANK